MERIPETLWIWKPSGDSCHPSLHHGCQLSLKELSAAVLAVDNARAGDLWEISKMLWCPCLQPANTHFCLDGVWGWATLPFSASSVPGNASHWTTLRTRKQRGVLVLEKHTFWLPCTAKDYTRGDADDEVHQHPVQWWNADRWNESTMKERALDFSSIRSWWEKKISSSVSLW